MRGLRGIAFGVIAGMGLAAAADEDVGREERTRTEARERAQEAGAQTREVGAKAKRGVESAGDKVEEGARQTGAAMRGAWEGFKDGVRGQRSRDEVPPPER